MDISILALITVLFFSNLIVDLDYDFLNFKPFSCTKCLGFWLGLLTFPFTGFYAPFIAFSAYLINKYISAFI